MMAVVAVMSTSRRSRRSRGNSVLARIKDPVDDMDSTIQPNEIRDLSELVVSEHLCDDLEWFVVARRSGEYELGFFKESIDGVVCEERFQSGVVAPDARLVPVVTETGIEIEPRVGQRNILDILRDMTQHRTYFRYQGKFSERVCPASATTSGSVCAFTWWT